MIPDDGHSLDLIRHAISGELFVAESAPVWKGDRCVAATIVRLAGPVAQPAYVDETGTPLPGWADRAEQELANALDAAEYAAWANAQEWREVASTI
jgi:hypothetical protein